MANTKKYVSLDKLGLYDEKIKKFLADADAAALKSAKDYTDESFGLANENAASLANTAEANAKAYADGKDAAIQAAHKAGTDAAAAAAAADAKAVAAQGDVDALEGYVGTFTHETAKSVVEYIDAKTSGIASEDAMTQLTDRVGVVEGKVATIEGDYLKGSDKTELEGKIGAVQTAVDTEKSRAEGIEAGLESRLAAVEGDYLKGADKEELQGNINTLTGVVNTLRDGVDADKVDGVKDLIDYVEEHGAEVTGMKEDIAGNTEAIDGVADRVETLEGEMDAVQGAVATKAEKEYVDSQIEALQGVDTGLDDRIKALEAKHGNGEGTVESMIAAAKQEAIDAAAGDAASKANAAESAAKGHADSLNTAMNTRVEALEAIDHDHANKAELDLIASGDKAKWDDAYAKRHEHGNLAVLEGITSDKITAWDTVTSKAAQSDLTAVGDRVTAIETWHSNFVEVSEEEINGLFA